MLRSFLPKLTLLVASGLAGLLMLEIGVRLLGLSSPSVGRIDCVRGWALRPGVTVKKSREGSGLVSINSDGLRDDEHPKDRPEGAFRIAVLGDSFTLASHVEVDKTYWSILERLLGDCPALAGLQVEIINFGVTGYGTAQEFLTLRHHALQYEPQLVVVAAFTGNDIVNNSRALAKDPLAPYFELVDGELVLDARFLHSPEYRQKRWTYEILYFSHLAQVLKDVVGTGHGPAATTALEHFRHSEDPELYRPPDSDTWKAAWRVTDALFAAIHEEAANRGARLVLATLSNPIQVYPDAAVRASAMKELGIGDPWYPERAFQAIGERHGFSVVSLAPPMLEEAERSARFLHGFSNTILGVGHWNLDGHEVAAELLAPAICEILEKG